LTWPCQDELPSVWHHRNVSSRNRVRLLQLPMSLGCPERSFRLPGSS
jgi:hypothetical protein